MSAPVYFLTLGLVVGTILVVFAMRYASANQQARARLAHDQAYREIAATAVADQAVTAAAISSIQAAITEIGTRITAIERVLQEVE
jgi:HAMP domain-containing protein